MASGDIRWLAMDVDGTLTDGKIYMAVDGEAFKAFDIKDGLAIHELLPKMGVEPVVITGRESAIVARRCAELGIREVRQGAADKLAALRAIVAAGGGTLAEVAYVGDDLNDLACLRAVREAGGVAACPADAVREVAEACDYVATRSGGAGAVREVVEWIASGKALGEDE